MIIVSLMCQFHGPTWPTRKEFVHLFVMVPISCVCQGSQATPETLDNREKERQLSASGYPVAAVTALNVRRTTTFN